jgi:Aspartyl/Asparaginyl beta-hydroxylase
MGRRFTGTVEPLCPVSVDDVVGWLLDIPYLDWPQQHRIDDALRPAMVNDPAWHGFGVHTNLLVAELLEHFPGCTDRNRMLSVVMPGHVIPAHRDLQGPRWVTRLHVPLLTSERASLRYHTEDYHLAVGLAYQVNTERLHEITNDGADPRVHFMFDIDEIG